MIGRDAEETVQLPEFTVTPAPTPAELAAIVAAFRIRDASAAPPAVSDAWRLAARQEALRGQLPGWGLDGWKLAARVRR